MVAAASPAAVAAFSSSAELSRAPSSAAATMPPPLSVRSRETRMRPVRRTAKTATRAARPTMARAAGTPVTSPPLAVSGRSPPATDAVPWAQSWREASSARAAPRAPSSSAAAMLRRLLRWAGLSASASIRGGGTAEVTRPLSLQRPSSRRAAGSPVWMARSTAAALLRHSVSSATGSESATTPAPGLDVRRAVAEQGGADGDGGVGVAGEVEVADAAAVQAAPGRLQLVDDLHGARLGRAGEGAGREAGGEHVEGGAALGDPAGDRRHDVHDVRVPLDRT